MVLESIFRNMVVPGRIYSSRIVVTVRCTPSSTTIGRSRCALGVRLPLAGFARDLTLHDRQFYVGLF